MKINPPPKPNFVSAFFDLSELAHRQGLKRSLVGVGGLKVRGQQRLTLTLVRYLMIAHLQNPKHNKINTPSKCRDSNVFKQTEQDAVGVLNSKTP